MTTQLICLRHAEPELYRGDPERAPLGADATPDTPLTERGRQQAQAVAHRLQGEQPQSVFVSQAKRSYQTGEIIAAHLGAPLEVVPDLIEASMGRRDRRARELGLAAEVLRQWLVEGQLDAHLPGGETGHQVVQRMTKALGAIAAQCRDGLAIVVAHSVCLPVGVSALCENGPEIWGKQLVYATPFPLVLGSAGWQVEWPAPTERDDVASD